MDWNIRAALAVRVEPGVAMKLTVRHTSDFRRHPLMRIVENSVDVILEVFLPVVLDEFKDALSPGPDGAKLGHQIAIEPFLPPYVREVHTNHVLGGFSFFIEFDRRKLQAFLPHILRSRRDTGRHKGTAIELMTLGHTPEQVLALVEDRAGGH